MTGGLARGLHGRLIDELGPVRSEAPPYPLASEALAPIRKAAEQQGEYGFGPMWAGQAAPLGQPLPAAELTRKLAADALAILGPPGVDARPWKSSPFPPSPTITSGWSTTRRAARPRSSIRATPRRPWPKPRRRGWTITQVWNTHCIPDHSGGNVAMKEATGCTVSGPAAEEHPRRAMSRLSEGAELRIGDQVGRVIEIPGHTLGHIALIFDDERVAFVGDTLFAMGCGRLFEGTRSKCTIRSSGSPLCPTKPRFTARHEYTLANARFATHAEPDNPAIAARLEEVQALREAGKITASDQRRPGT